MLHVVYLHSNKLTTYIKSMHYLHKKDKYFKTIKINCIDFLKK